MSFTYFRHTSKTPTRSSSMRLDALDLSLLLILEGNICQCWLQGIGVFSSKLAR